MNSANRNRFDLNDLRMLVDVVDNGGYTAASKVTGIAKSTLSQRIAALERNVGVPLLRRTPRSLSLTGAGKLLLAHGREIDALARRAEGDLRGLDTAVCGTLRVTCSVAQAQFALGNVIPKFLAEHPGVTIQMHGTNRFVDLVAEGFDLAVRSHGSPLLDSSLIQRVIGRIPWILVAAPSYLEGNVPRVPSELDVHETLLFGGGVDDPTWTLSNDDHNVAIGVRPRLWSEDMGLLRRTCIEGAGVVALPAYIVAQSIDEGRLCRVLPNWLAGDATLSLLMPPRGQGSHAGATFAAHVAANIPAILDPGLQVARSTD